MSEHGVGGRNPEIGFEKTDARPSAILRFLLWLLFGTVAVFILMRWMFVGLAAYEERQQPAPPVMKTGGTSEAPLPRLQARPAEELARYRSEQQTAPPWLRLDGSAGRRRSHRHRRGHAPRRRARPACGGRRQPQGRLARRREEEVSRGALVLAALLATAPRGQAEEQRPPLLREIGFDQTARRQRPPGRCRSATRAGRTVRLGDYFGKKPVVLCPRTTTPARCSAP